MICFLNKQCDQCTRGHKDSPYDKKRKKNFNIIKAVSYQTQTCQQDGTKYCNYALVFAGVPTFFSTKFRNVFMAHTKQTEWQKTMSINLNTHTITRKTGSK